jgi:hypothetical protein
MCCKKKNFTGNCRKCGQNYLPSIDVDIELEPMEPIG